jgi:isopentenyl diphosphate isomerase/L-lactate dehydrogenase-like FMN-dependent dehydrogenase
MKTAHNLHDYEAIARDALPEGAFAYYSGGAGDEHTLRDNVDAFARRRLRPRMLVDVSEIDTSVELLGSRYALPFGIAPTAQHGLADPDGEAATARAAASAGVLMCASTSSSRSLEDIAAASGDGPRWFQLYTQDDAGPRTEALIHRAEAAGYAAIALTVDLAVSGRRERELYAGFQLAGLEFGNFAGDAVALERWDKQFRQDVKPPQFTWRDLAWLRRVTRLPIILKGILTAEDATLAVEHGVDAVWVSNHGARQLDRVTATIDVLEEIAGAVGGRAEVYLDGGVRRGIDVVTALALGARAVFVGRPMLYALASGGEAGVAGALDLLSAEVRNAMALLGAPSVGAITRTHVDERPYAWSPGMTRDPGGRV